MIQGMRPQSARLPYPSNQSLQQFPSNSPYPGIPQRNMPPPQNLNFRKDGPSPPQYDDTSSVSHGMAPSVCLNPETQSASFEDMEFRLVLLFRKMIVFSSKLESLKAKILKYNPEFSSYKLFRQFSGLSNSHIGLGGMIQFLSFFRLDWGTRFVGKLMVFLSLYVRGGEQTSQLVFFWRFDYCSNMLG